MSLEKNKIRLSVLYFFEFCIFGGVVPVLSLYLKELPGFTGFKVGFVLSMTSIASVTSPLIAQRIADRYISAEKLFSVLHILCGIFIIIFRQQTNFAAVTVIYLLLMISLSPTSPLLNVLVFHSLGKDKTKYGFLRVWGTFGWIFMSAFFSYVWLGSDLLPFEKQIGDLYYITAFFCLFLGLFSLYASVKSRNTDSVTNDSPGNSFRPEYAVKNAGDSVKPEIIKLLKGSGGRELIYFIIISMLASIADKSYFLGISPFLKFSGFSEHSIMPSISIGMVPEIAAMFILYRFIKKYGYKTVLTAGISAHVIRFILFIAASESGADFLIFPGIFMHGFTFAFFIAVSYIFLDNFCSKKTRSSMHLFYAFIVAGTGNLAGNLIGGFLIDLSLLVRGNYTIFWLFPASASVSALLLLRKKISAG